MTWKEKFDEEYASGESKAILVYKPSLESFIKFEIILPLIADAYRYSIEQPWSSIEYDRCATNLEKDLNEKWVKLNKKYI